MRYLSGEIDTEDHDERLTLMRDEETDETDMIATDSRRI